MTIHQVAMLSAGDVVFWRDPDGPGRAVVVETVRVRGDGDDATVCVTDASGDYLECLACELSRTA